LNPNIVKTGKQRPPDFYVRCTPFWIFDIEYFDPSHLTSTGAINRFEFVTVNELKRCAAFKFGGKNVKTVSGHIIEVSQYALDMSHIRVLSSVRLSSV